MAIVLPHSFQDNVEETASGVQVDENFDVLKTAIEALEARVATLEARFVPQVFLTAGLVGVVVGGSEHTIVLPAGTLVEFNATVKWEGSGDQGLILQLRRDGVVVHEENLARAGSGTAFAFLRGLEPSGGSHTWQAICAPYGTNQTFSLTSGIIKFGL